MKKTCLISLLFASLMMTFAAGCNTGPTESMANDMTIPGAGVNPAGGVRDPSVKPIPTPMVKPIARGGIADDGVRPVAPTNARVGVADDGVRPMNGRTGGSDDSIRPKKP